MFKKKLISTISTLLAISLILTACVGNGRVEESSSLPSASITSTPAPTSAPTSSEPDTSGSEPGTTSDPTQEPETTATIPSADLSPVENRSPETNYEPAFAGQTRANGMATSIDLNIEIIADDLARPWAVKALPDGRLAITEKGGTLRIATTDGALSAKITGFPAVDDRSQGGLLDVEPAPDFTDSRMLYFTLAERTNQGSLTAVGRGRLSDDESQIENFEIVYRAEPYYNNSMHFGSRLLFDKDGNLFVSTGERSDARTRSLAQELDNGYGKIIHIIPDGQPAPGAPFVSGVPEQWREIYTYGHRNVQGMAFHPGTGDLWISEMGPRGGDELNLILPGGNYGWPLVSYGIEYSGAAIPGGATSREGVEEPVYYWDPVLAPSGMAFYDSNLIPEWQNNLFIAGLRGQHVARLLIVDQKVVGEERLLADQGQRFRDVEEMDGVLYIISDSNLLYRIGRD